MSGLMLPVSIHRFEEKDEMWHENYVKIKKKKGIFQNRFMSCI